MNSITEIRHADWWPEDWLIAQWARHVEKLRRQLDFCARKDGPPPRMIIRARDVSYLITVSDGDGFMAAGLRMRLHGIDAPELNQKCRDEKGRSWPCGKRARRRLIELLRSGKVEILLHGVDIYGRILITCFANGRNVNATLVREGLAVAYIDDCYKQEEAQARRERRGIWRGKFEMPQSWRRRRRGASRNGWMGCTSTTGDDRSSSSDDEAWAEQAVRAMQKAMIPERKDDKAPLKRSPEREAKWAWLSRALDDLIRRLDEICETHVPCA